MSKFLLAFEEVPVSDLTWQTAIVHYVSLVFESFSKHVLGQSFLIKKRLPLQLLTDGPFIVRYYVIQANGSVTT
jgi:hypothetical protein